MKTFRFLFKYAKPYYGPLTVTVVSMILLVGVQLLAPWIIRTMIAAVQEGGEAATDLVGRLAMVALVVFVGRAGLQFLRSYMAHVAGWSVVADARQEIYSHLQRLSLRFYEDKQTGQLMSRMVNDSDLFERMISHAVPDVMVNALRLSVFARCWSR